MLSFPFHGALVTVNRLVMCCVNGYRGAEEGDKPLFGQMCNISIDRHAMEQITSPHRNVMASSFTYCG